MSKVARNGGEEEEQLFEYFLDLPTEIRLMIVKKMAIRDRFRFARCSRLGWNLWAMVTKSQPCSIFYRTAGEKLEIRIEYSDNGFWPEEGNGFILKFFYRYPQKQFIEYISLSGRLIWSIEVDDCFNVIRLGKSHFLKAVCFFANSISTLSIEEQYSREKRLSIPEDTLRRLTNLETLKLLNCQVILQLLLPNIRHPLKNLIAMERSGRKIAARFIDQIFQVQHNLQWSYSILSYEQFLQLKATHVTIRIGNFTANNIFNFIKSWQNGEYNGKMESCAWMLNYWNYEVLHLLCELLGINKETIYDRHGIILERKDSTRKAELWVTGYGQLKLTMENESYERPVIVINDDNDET